MLSELWMRGLGPSVEECEMVSTALTQRARLGRGIGSVGV